MKQYFILWILLVLWEQANAQSMPTNRMTAIVEPSFVANQLTHQQLLAFQNRALQKVEDLEDYLQIVANPEFDKSLRKQAAEMVADLFIEGATIHTDTNSSLISIQQFLQNLLQSETPLPPMSLQNKYLQMPLSWEINEGYTGEIHYQLINDTVLVGERIVSISLQKVQKFFGDTSEYVWEVRFGKVVQ